MKITLEFVGWLDERLYSRAVCGLLEKRAICPPLEAERNFERREGGEGGEREGVSPSNFLTRGSTCALRVASFERPIPRRWNLFFLSSYSLSSYWFSAQIENFESKFSSDWPGWIGQVKIKTKVNSCEKSLT